jgi:hypothetical protein
MRRRRKRGFSDAVFHAVRELSAVAETRNTSSDVQVTVGIEIRPEAVTMRLPFRIMTNPANLRTTGVDDCPLSKRR